MAVHQPISFKLGTLSIEQIPQLASIIPHTLLLRDVELIVPTRQRILQILNTSLGMQSPPWLRARLRLARLEHEEERVQTGDGLGEGDAQEGLGRLLVCVQEIAQLVGVGLFPTDMILASVLLKDRIVTNLQIIELVLVVTPDRVVERIAPVAPDDPQRFVGII